MGRAADWKSRNMKSRRVPEQAIAERSISLLQWEPAMEHRHVHPAVVVAGRDICPCLGVGLHLPPRMLNTPPHKVPHRGSLQMLSQRTRTRKEPGKCAKLGFCPSQAENPWKNIPCEEDEHGRLMGCQGTSRAAHIRYPSCSPTLIKNNPNPPSPWFPEGLKHIIFSQHSDVSNRCGNDLICLPNASFSQAVAHRFIDQSMWLLLRLFVEARHSRYFGGFLKTFSLLIVLERITSLII